MKSFAFEDWDGGRLTVNRELAELFRRNGLLSFDDFMAVQGDVAKDFLAERTTLRFSLPDQTGNQQDFYIKRHTRSSWKEYAKPLLRLRWPILGARHEWEAILQFHEAGINTMTPAALGERGSRSFLVTRAIEGCGKLSHRLRASRQSGDGSQFDAATTRQTIQAVAEVARRMHDGGLHHQDFYVHHLLLPQNDRSGAPPYVIDLGRACRKSHLARRWIVKDLAQLSYSAPECSKSQRLRFLRAYLGRPLKAGDRQLMWQIGRKVTQIARHSSKHGL